MTFDRLQPNPSASRTVCVKVDVSGSFKAISVPPTLKWRPALASDRAIIQDLPTAIEANSHIPPERKRFLIRRLGYWHEWASRDQRGIISSGDEE